MPKVLTAKSVEQSQRSERRREIPDGLLPGFYLVVQPSGAKSWAVRYRHGSRPKKLTLGTYPALTLADARKDARTALRAVAQGNDPATTKRVARQDAAVGRDLVETVVADFLERHAKAKRTHSEIKRMFEKEVLPKWRGRRIQDISRRDVIELLDGLIDRGIGRMTNMVFSILRKLFNWAISRDIVTASPCAGMRPPVAEVTRDRVLTDDEIKRFWRATEGLGYPFREMFRLLLVSGQRLGEVSGMSRRELDLDAKLWSLPRERVKNDRPHDVPLSTLAVDIITAVPKIAGECELVFTSNGGTPSTGFSRAKANLDRALASDRGDAIEPFTLHDLRRTTATGFQRLGIPPHVTEAILNHKSGVIRGVAAVYARHDYANEKRAALDDWARHLERVISGKAANVLSIRKGKVRKIA